jgi:hypothetical protein
VMIAASDDGRRMGDRLAETVVERYDPAAPLETRIGWTALGLIGGFVGMSVLPTRVVPRMEISRAATAYAERTLGGGRGPARGASIRDGTGWVTLDSDLRGPVRIHLERSDGEWSVVDVRRIPDSELTTAFHIEW